jgi:hypothetical protein
MKTNITRSSRERLFSCINQLEERYEKEVKPYEPLLDLLQEMGALKIASFATDEELIKQTHYDRIQLELSKLGVGQSEEEVGSLVSRVLERAKELSLRAEKVIRFQEENKIPSLVDIDYTIGDHSESFWVFGSIFDRPLNMTEEDVNCLEQDRDRVIEKFCEHTRYQGNAPYQAFPKQQVEVNWQEVTNEYVKLVCPFYRWAIFWKQTEDNNILFLGNEKDLNSSGPDLIIANKPIQQENET